LNIEKLVMRTAIAVLLLCAVGVAQAQTAWNSNTITWDAPTACDTGVPVANCPVVGYRIERSATPTGTFTTVGNVAGSVLTFTHTNALAGQNCYRVSSVDAIGPTVPSAAACRTNTAPTPRPNPPTNLRVIETTVFNLTQIERRVMLGSDVGTVPLNTICGTDAVMGGFRVVARSNVKFTKPQPVGTLLVARCA
jgi:hypothetical protein